ncbi:MAG: Ig-like domain repeat protein [Treponemataceae bacterium]
MAKVNFIKKVFFVSVCFFVALLFNSCPPGLGGAVDVFAPAVSVSSPITKSVISGPFTMTGSCSDETAITSVVVQFFKINSNGTKTLYTTQKASVNKEKWKLSLNSLTGTRIPDGDYSITITANDNGGHASSCDVVYTIDNKAPTVLLTSPNTYEATPEFTRIGTIKGEVYDATTLSKVTVYIADSTGATKVSKIAEGTNTFLAAFTEDELSCLTNDRVYFYYAVAEDGVTVGNVNKNTYNYHKSDIYGLIPVGTVFPSINALGSLDQGTAATLDCGLSATNLASKRFAIAKSGATERAYPCFRFYNSEPKKIQWHNVDRATNWTNEKKLSLGSSVIGTILPTSDESSPRNFQVWVKKCEGLGADSRPIFSAFVDSDKITCSNEPGIRDTVQGAFTSLGATYNFEIRSKDPSVAGAFDWESTYWKVKVQYELASGGAPIFDEAIFAVSSSLPILTESTFGGIESPIYYRGYMNAETKIAGKNKFSGRAVASDNLTPVDSVKLFKNNDLIHSEDLPYETSTKTYTKVFNYATDGSQDEVVQYTIKADKGGIVTEIVRIVIIDTIKPKIELNNLANGDILSQKRYLVKGIIDDKNGITKTEYKIDVDGVTKVDWKESTLKTKLEVQLDTELGELLSEGKTYKLYVRSLDVAGNQTGDNECVCTFSVDLGKPRAGFVSPAKYTGVNYALVKEPPLVKGIADDALITAGKQALEAKLFYTRGDSSSEVEVVAGTGANEFNWNRATGAWQWQMPSSFSGTYNLKLVVKDSVGNISEAEHKLIIDKNAPVILFDSISSVVERGGAKFVNGKINAILKIDDDDQISVINYFINGVKQSRMVGGVPTDNFIDNSTSTFNLVLNGIDTDNASFPDGTKLSDHIKITAKDRSGNVTEFTGDTCEFANYKIDQGTDKPSFEGSNFEVLASKEIAGFAKKDSLATQATENNIFDKTSGMLFITLADDDGLNKIFIKVDDETSWTDIGSVISGQQPKTAQYKLAVKNIAGLTYGRHKIYFKVTDSNYVSDVATPNSYVETGVYYIAIDDARPALNITTQSAQFVSNSFNISGETTDECNIEKLEFISKNTSNQDVVFYSLTPVTPATTVASPWSITWDMETDNKKVADITIRATDGIGRVMERVFTYKKDTTAPLLSVEESTDSMMLRYNLDGCVINASNTVYIYGTFNDDNDGALTNPNEISGVTKIEWGLVKDWYKTANDVTVWSNAVMGKTINRALGYKEEDKVDGWYISYAKPEFEDGKYTLIVRAIDAVGNISDTTRKITTTTEVSKNYQKTGTGTVGLPFNVMSSSADFDPAEYARLKHNSNFNIIVDLTSPKLKESTFPNSNEATLYTKRNVSVNGTIKEANYVTDTEYNFWKIKLGGSEMYTKGFSVTAESGVDIGTYNVNYTANGDGNGTWSWTHNFASDGLYKIIINAKDKAFWNGYPEKNSAILTRNIVVDSESPTVTVTSVNPVLTYKGIADTVNGKNLTLKAIVVDSNLKSAMYTYDYNADDSLRNWATATSFTDEQLVSGITLSVDTTNPANYHSVGGKNYLNLCFKAEDKSGNVAYKKFEYVIEQESDKPVFTPSNIIQLSNRDDAGFDASNNPKNILGKTSNNNISVNLSDDDGLKDIYVAVNGAPSTKIGDLSGNSMVWSYNVKDLPYGRHTLVFKLNDIYEGTSNAFGTYNYTEYTAHIAIDDGAPLLSVNNISSNGTFVSRTFKISGTVSDANGIASITVKEVQTGTGTIGQNIKIDNPSPSWEIPAFTLTHDSGTIKVIAVDGIGHQIEKELDYTVDEEKPVITMDPDSVGPFYVDAVSAGKRLTGKFTDLTSGIDEVRFVITGDATPPVFVPSTGQNASLIVSSGDFVVNADFTGMSGKRYVHINGRDKAGNWCENATSVEVNIDSAAPQTTVTPMNGIFTSSQVFSGTATDDQDLKSLTATFRGESSPLYSVNLSGKNQAWSFTLPASAAEGKNREIVFKVVDQCQKETSYTYKYTIDRTAPNITWNNIEASDGLTKFTSVNSSSIKISVGFSDSISGVRSLQYQFQHSNDGGLSYTDFSGAGASGTLNYTAVTSGSVNISMASFLAGQTEESVVGTTDGLWKLKIIATDEAGISQTYTSNAFWVDQNKPYLSTPSFDILHAKGDNFSYSGSVYDKEFGKINRVEIFITHPSYTVSEKAKYSVILKPDETPPLGATFAWNAVDKKYNFTWIPGGSLTDESPYIYDGSYVTTISVYDEAGNEREQTIKTACDNTPPQMKFSRPYVMNVDASCTHDVTTGNATDVLGTVSVTGTIPASGEDSMGKIFYQIGKSDAITILLEDGSSITNMSNYVNGIGSRRIKTISLGVGKGAIEDGVVDNPITSGTDIIVGGKWKNSGDSWNWNFDFKSLNIVNGGFADRRTSDNLWTTYVYVVARDQAGNMNFGVYPINIDTDSDKPTVTISYPDPNSPKNEVGGSFTVSGLATDDYVVSKVYMQVEVINGNYVNGVLTARSGAENYVPGTVFPGEEIIREGGVPMKDATGNTVTSYFSKAQKDVGVKGAYTNKDYWYEVDGVTGLAPVANWKLKINNSNVNKPGSSIDGKRIFDNMALKDFYTDSWVTSGYRDGDQTQLKIRVMALDTKEEGPANAVFGEVKEVTVFIDSGAPSIELTSMPSADIYLSQDFDYEINLSDDGNVDSYSVTATGSRGKQVITSVTGHSGSSARITGTFDLSELINRCGNAVTITVEATDNNIKQTVVTRRFYIDISAPTFEKAKVGSAYMTTYLYNDPFGEGSVRDENQFMRIAGGEATIRGYMQEESGGSGIAYAMLFFTAESDDTRVFSVGGNSSDPYALDTTGEVMTHTATVYTESGSTRVIHIPFDSFANVNKNLNGVTYNSVTKRISNGSRTKYIVIDCAEGGSDLGVNADNDGYDENMAASGIWYMDFDSALLNDGKYHVNYLIADSAGNVRFFQDKMFVCNHAPTVTKLTMNTDIMAVDNLSADNEVNFVPKRTGSTRIDMDYDLKDSPLTDTTVFKSLNYYLQFGFDVSGANGGLVYHMKWTNGTDEYTIASNSSTLPTGISWNAAKTAFEFKGNTCKALKATGSITYTVWVEDVLGLSTGSTTFVVSMENTDTENPVAQLLAFNTDAYVAMTDPAWQTMSDSHKNRGTFDKDIGHIEPRKSILSSNEKPTLSGKVYIRGEAFDNQRIQKIEVKITGDTVQTYDIATWSGGALTFNTAYTGELHQFLNQKGHYLEFAYLWDTSTISGVAKNNVSIELVIFDGGGRTSTVSDYASTENIPRSSSNFYTTNNWGYGKTDVDVVPYITKIGTALDGAYKKKTSVFNRSANGKYPVQQSEIIKIFGFNLNNTGVNKVVVNGTAVPGGESLNYTVPSSAKSGPLLVKVNGVDSINNINDNKKDYNKEPNNVNNNILNDDRYLYVWKFYEIRGDTTIRYPTMRVGKDVGQTVGFVYDSGAQDTRMNLNGADFRIDHSFTQWYDTACAVDNAGRIYGSSMNGDSGAGGNNDNGGYANYGFYAWNTASHPGNIYKGSGSTWSNLSYQNPNSDPSSRMAYNSGRKKVALENSYNGANFSANRVKNPKIVATSSAATNSQGNVYTIYYESLSNQVRFRYGTVSGNMNSDSQLTFSGGLGNHGNNGSGSANGFQIIAGSGATGISSSTGTNNVNRVGEYVAVGVTSSGTAVVAWYDSENQSLMFSYNTTPGSNADKWGQNTKVIDGDFAGWYVDLKVDPDDGVHIAYYGASAGDLKYAYLPSYSQDAQICTVDSYLSVGTCISIDVSNEKKSVTKPDGTIVSRYIPYISYYMSAFMETKFSNRIAWLAGVAQDGKILDGAIDDEFTGNWEVMTVPTGRIPLNYTVGVGIRKNSSLSNTPFLGYGTKTGLETAHLQ